MNTQTSDAANERWRQHTEDEAVARKDQQRSAGRNHEPVQGPPPYGNEQVNLMAAEIVAAERERCALLVETWRVAPAITPAELLRQLAAELRRPS